MICYNSTMLCDSLGQFIDELRRAGELCEISQRVDPVLEAAEIAERAVKGGGPALLFKNPAGCGIPLLMNLYGTEKRMLMAFGLGSFNEIASRIENLTKSPAGGTIWDKLAQVPKLIEASHILPKPVSRDSAPCKQTVIRSAGEIDLSSLPVIKCWPKDADKFITFPAVITRNPKTGVQNVGMYRMQILSRNETAMHWHLHKDGAYNASVHAEGGRRKVPVSVAIGADPVTMYSATAPVPSGVDELLLAGFIRNKPVEVVKSELSDIMVPAHSEIVLEGHVDLDDLRPEGPFGDHTGYYSPQSNYPVFKVECVTMRRNPVYIATVVGIPPMEDYFLGLATTKIFLPLLRLQCPEVIDMSFPRAGVFHNLALVKIKKMYHGHAQKVMNYFWGQNQLCFTKNIVVFDEDVDINNHGAALFTMLSNVDFRRDVVLMDGPVDILDHSAPVEGYGTKVGIDATAKKNIPGVRDFPELLKMSEGVKKLVDSKWESLGIKLP